MLPKYLSAGCDFNPRSLAGATGNTDACYTSRDSISIHAPSRERPDVKNSHATAFYISIHAPSRERHGQRLHHCCAGISIHAPSRERRYSPSALPISLLFQSTLPRGSDFAIIYEAVEKTSYFNPRSLAGATGIKFEAVERIYYFNPRSLAGATSIRYLCADGT